MAVLHLSTAAQNASADAVVDLVDAGAGPGTVKIYTGAPPADANTAASGSLLGTVTLADPAYGSSVAGVATGTDPASVNWSASGTAGWFRMADSNGNTVMDGDVTVTGGTGTMQLSSITAVSGSPIDITALSYTQPSGA